MLRVRNLPPPSFVIRHSGFVILPPCSPLPPVQSFRLSGREPRAFPRWPKVGGWRLGHLSLAIHWPECRRLRRPAGRVPTDFSPCRSPIDRARELGRQLARG